MTAQAAKAAIERTIKLGGGASYIWGAVSSISTPSQYTLVFQLKYPSPLSLEASADYSAYIYDTAAAGSGSLTNWLNAAHDAGTGPYELKTYNSGQEFEVILKTFPGYWGGWSGPHYRTVVFRVVPQVVATLLKSSLAKLNINLTVQGLSWPTQWAKGKSASASQRQDIFMEYWWPDYADPYSWFINLLYAQSQPYYNLSYYSSATLDSQINQVESLVATNPAAGEQLYRTMQVEILQQAPIVFFYNTNYQYAMLSNFTGLQVNPAYPNVVFAYDLKPQSS